MKGGWLGDNASYFPSLCSIFHGILFYSCYTSSSCGKLALNLSESHSDVGDIRGGTYWNIGLITISILLTGFTVYDQVFHRVGLQFIWYEELRGQRWVIEGTSIDPWQYRIFAPYVIEGIRWFVEWIGLTASYGRIFLGLRILQNLLIFIAVGWYWQKVGVSKYFVVIAMMILAWRFTYSNYATGLAFDTYFDLLLYILAALAIIRERYLWIIPLSALAAINRETGILIPVLLLSSAVELRPKISIDKRRFYIAIAGLLIFSLLYVGIRIAYGPRPFDHMHEPGLNQFLANLKNPFTYYSSLATFLLFPILALLRWRSWPSILRSFFWVLVPIWIVVHSFTSVLAEARLFLVPYAVVIIPAVFAGIVCPDQNQT